MTVPVYDYPEQPVSALRRGAVSAAPAAALRAVNPESDMEPDLELDLAPKDAPAGNERATEAPPKVMGPVAASLLVFVVGLVLPGMTLYFQHKAHKDVGADLLVGALVLLACWAVGVAYRRRQAGYVARGVTALETGPVTLGGRDARHQFTWLNSLGSGLSLGGLAVVGSSLSGDFAWIAWLITGVVVLAVLTAAWDLGRPSAAAVVRGVGQRLGADAGSAQVEPGAGPALASTGSVARTKRATALSPGARLDRPLEILRARDLPAADPATASVFARWTARGAWLERQAKWGRWTLWGLRIGVPVLWVAGLVHALPSEGAAWDRIARDVGPWHLVCALMLLGGLALRSLGLWWFEQQAYQRWPLPQPRRLVLLRVFGAPSYEDLMSLVQPWFRVGDVAHLDGADSVGQREEVLVALEAGKVDDVLVKSEAEALARAQAWSREPDEQLLYRRHVEQCTARSWQIMVSHLLDSGQAVLMDLSGLGPANKGCDWELGQLLNRVPLERVTLLVDQSTDFDVLHSILAQAEAGIDAASPNAGRRQPWQALQVGGQSQRRGDESHAEWLRRMDARLDAEALAAWLYRRALPDAAGAGDRLAPERFPKVSLAICGALALLAVFVLPH
jgi:hypothetical protein